MSVLVLGAGTDYALLLVARYREELHHTVDKHEAMRTALASAGPAIFASAATVIAALLCLMLAKVNGTAGLGPIAAIGIACAALSMLTLLPALLTIFGRRAFWPFVPHTPETAPAADAGLRAGTAEDRRGLRRRRARSGRPRLLVVLVLLPLVLLNWLLRRLSGRRIPSLIVGPLDRAVFTPYEVRRPRARARRRRHPRLLEAVGDRVAVSPRRVMLGSIAVLLILCAGFAFFSTDLTSEDSYRTEVESVEGQHLLDKSFPSGTTALTDIVVPDRGRSRRRAQPRSRGRRGRGGLRPVAEGAAGRPWSRRRSNPTPTRPRPSTWSSRSATRPHGGRAGRARRRPDRGRIRRPRRRRLGLDRDPAAHPPRRLPDPDRPAARRGRAAVLIGTVILSFLAALGVGYFVFDVVFGFPGSDPSLPLFAFVFLVALGVDYNIFLIARAREETTSTAPNRGSCAPSPSPAASSPAPASSSPAPSRCSPSLPLTFLTELGFVVAFGVLLDTFLVRSVLVPAIALIWATSSGGPRRLSRDAPPAASSDAARPRGPAGSCSIS